MCTVPRECGGWVEIYVQHETGDQNSWFRKELRIPSKSFHFSWSLHETTFLNQSSGPIFRQKICLMMTSSSKTERILWRSCGQHVDVDMGQELMKLRVSFDKSGSPDPLISQTPRRVIYAFFISSRFQFVPMRHRVLHFNLIPRANRFLRLN